MEDDYREYLFSLGLSLRTIIEYCLEMRRALVWMDEHGHDLATVPPSIVAEYSESRVKSWSTRKMIRSALAHHWTMTGRARPPVGAVRVPPKPRPRCRALEEGDSRILAKAARSRGDDPGLAVALMLYAGLRRMEVATLRWECFDPPMEWLTIVGKLDVEGTIPVHERLRDLLVAKGRTVGYVFPGRFPDQPSTSHRIYHWVRKVAKEAGVPDVAPHRLRHVALATALDATGDLKHVAGFARHRDSRSVDTYTRTTNRRLRAVVESLDY
jgi:integrase